MDFREMKKQFAEINEAHIKSIEAAETEQLENDYTRISGETKASENWLYFAEKELIKRGKNSLVEKIKESNKEIEDINKEVNEELEDSE